MRLSEATIPGCHRLQTYIRIQVLMTRSSDFCNTAEDYLKSMARLPLCQTSPAADLEPMTALKQAMPPPVTPSPLMPLLHPTVPLDPCIVWAMRCTTE